MVGQGFNVMWRPEAPSKYPAAGLDDIQHSAGRSSSGQVRPTFVEMPTHRDMPQG